LLQLFAVLLFPLAVTAGKATQLVAAAVFRHRASVASTEVTAAAAPPNQVSCSTHRKHGSG
jgi:hypothetical protein